MKRLAFPIAIALLAGSALVAIPFTATLAQTESGGVDQRKANTRAVRNAEKNKTKQATENPFPNATRKEPEAKASSKLAKKIDKAVKALYDEKYDDAEKVFNELLADAKANDYEKAMAYQGLANIANDRDDDVNKVLEYTRKSLDLDALPNVTHFGALLQYANLSMSEEKYAEAVTAIDQWLKLTGTEKDLAYAIRGQSLYRMEKLDEAAASIRKAIALSKTPNEGWYQLLMACYYEQEKFPEAVAEGEAALKVLPGSKVITRLLGNVYIQAEQPDKAVALLSAAYQNGMMTSESEVKQLYQLYNFGDRPLEAIKVIEEGMAKGVLPRNQDHLRAMGDAYRMADKPIEAAQAFGEAAQFATDGEMKFLQAYTLYEAEKNAEARTAVQEALKKTPFKSEGQAWILLGGCELILGNKPGAILAYQKATGFEATRASAESWLKNVSKM
ncbi:MAG TPA: tetratricopeptide repeat protein [Pseudomonadota bacterium]|nr:tetratricopeptide repeat protein [Rhodanobacteraceae bacterium]HQW81132.1 tetratricopeptide repeat protein [Pseudomonadota bacterium]